MKYALALAAVVLVSACGGENPDPKTAGKAPATTATTTPVSTAAANDAKVAEDRTAAAEKEQKAMREQFMQACVAKLPAPDYCECSWGEFGKVFKGNEENADPAKMEEFKTRIGTNCASKLPEDTVKTTFVASCQGTQTKELQTYCGCAWTELRKRVSLADFAGALDSDKGKVAKREMIKACGKQFPEASAKKEFDQGCATNPENKPFCDCAWKVIRGSASAAEIAANLVDMDAVRPKLQTTCGKLKK